MPAYQIEIGDKRFRIEAKTEDDLRSAVSKLKTQVSISDRAEEIAAERAPAPEEHPKDEPRNIFQHMGPGGRGSFGGTGNVGARGAGGVAGIVGTVAPVAAAKMLGMGALGMAVGEGTERALRAGGVPELPADIAGNVVELGVGGGGMGAALRQGFRGLMRKASGGKLAPLVLKEAEKRLGKTAAKELAEEVAEEAVEKGVKVGSKTVPKSIVQDALEKGQGKKLYFETDADGKVIRALSPGQASHVPIERKIWHDRALVEHVGRKAAGEATEKAATRALTKAERELIGETMESPIKRAEILYGPHKGKAGEVVRYGGGRRPARAGGGNTPGHSFLKLDDGSQVVMPNSNFVTEGTQAANAARTAARKGATETVKTSGGQRLVQSANQAAEKFGLKRGSKVHNVTVGGKPLEWFATPDKAKGAILSMAKKNGWKRIDVGKYRTPEGAIAQLDWTVAMKAGG